MQKTYQTLQEYHDLDRNIQLEKYEQPLFRIGLLSERSSDVTFQSTNRNAIVVDLSGTDQHLSQMDGLTDKSPTQPGDVCLIPPDIEVRFAWTVKDPIQHSIVVEFDTRLFEMHLPEFAQDRVASGHMMPAMHAPRPFLASLARLLAREIDPAQRRGRLFTDTAMRLLVLETAASHWSVPVPAADVDGGADARVQRALDFIEARFADDITLTEISLASGLSLTQLTARFHRHTGSTPYSYVVDRRLRQAAHLLSTTDMPIAHVAIETGFSDQQHMTRVFKARRGRTPNQIRKG